MPRSVGSSKRRCAHTTFAPIAEASRLQTGLVIVCMSRRNHRVQVKLRGVLAQQFQSVCRGKRGRPSPYRRRVVHNDATACLRADNRLTLSVQQQMRQNRRTPRTRTQNLIQSDSSIAGRLPWAGRAFSGCQINIVNGSLLREVHLADHLHAQIPPVILLATRSRK